MIPFLTYLLKVALCSGLLTAYYFIALRNRAFHQWNRFYLLATVVLSLTLPLLTFTIVHSSGDQSAAIQFVGAGDEYVAYVTTNQTPAITLEQGFLFAYLAVSITLLAILFFSVYKIIALIRKHPIQTVQSIQFINSNIKGTPFSFFRYIFWNPSIDLHSENGNRIFRHELAHVRERHSLDKLFLQLALVFFWMNPFLWIIRYELRMIHEFIADRKALDQQDASALAAMILQAAYPTRYNQLINSFFHQSLNRRIHMLAKKSSPRVSYISRILFIPLAACLVLAFSVRTQTAPIKEPVQSKVLSEFQSLEIMHRDTVPVSSKNIQTVNVTGEGIEVIYKDGTKARLSVAEANALGLNVKATRNDTLRPNPGGTTIKGDFNGLVVVDGKEYKEDLKKIDPKTIESINVLKGASAAAKYGDKGKDGVIEITLKKPLSQFKGLVIVDGEEYTGKLNDIDPNTIQSMNVFKGAAATEKYGSKGAEGVIEITLKQPTTQGLKDTPSATPQSPTFTQVEVEAQFPGGVPEWRNFLQNNLNASVPVEKGSPAGAFTVMVQLLVEKDGSLSEIKPLTSHGFGMEEEVVRTLTRSPKWVPAKQNGHVVRAYKKQPITFVISEADPVGEPTTKQ